MDAIFWINLVQAIFALVSLIVSNSAIVEAFKNLVNILVKQFPVLSRFTIKGTGTFVLSALVAYGLDVWARVDFSHLLGLNKYLNPELIFVATWAITLIFSGKVHDWFVAKKTTTTSDINLSATVSTPMVNTESTGIVDNATTTTTSTQTVTQKTE